MTKYGGYAIKPNQTKLKIDEQYTQYPNLLASNTLRGVVISLTSIFFSIIIFIKLFKQNIFRLLFEWHIIFLGYLLVKPSL